MIVSLLALALSTVAVATARVEATDISATSSSAVHVSGGLTAAVWETVPPNDAFRQREPSDNAEPSLRTEFRVAYDATTLFVKVRAFDAEPAKLITYLTRRDDDSPGDWLRIIIDSYHDRRTAYEFGVNPSGVKLDRYWFNDSNRDDSWDAVWDVSVARDGQGWSAEFRIPFSQLRFNPAAENTFGLAVSRDIGRLKETTTWPLLSKSANGYVSSFGELAGLSMSASLKRLELVPYVVTDMTKQPTEGNPLLKRSQPSAELGMDVKYALTPGLTFTGTINPDFGQVEADPAVVNLTAFETFFSERRPFFVEGSGTFNFGLECNDSACTGLFYSRRIGRAPQGTDDLDSGDDIYTDAPIQTTIAGAAKLTGRVGKYSVGVLQAFTQREEARMLNAGAFSRTTVEPSTSYTVGRIRREFANQSSVGAMLTSTKRSTGGGGAFLPDLAVTGGVDWDIRFRKWYSLTGLWAGSRIHGSADAISDLQQNSRHYFQRPDLSSAVLDDTRTSLAGNAGKIGISKIGGQHVRFNSNFAFKSPGFDINDVGFMRRADERSMGNWLQLRTEKPSQWFRTRTINFNQYASWNFDGDRLFSGGNVNANATFANNWDMGGGVGRQALGFDDRATRGGPGVHSGGFKEFWNWANTDPRRAVRWSYFIGGGGNGEGTTWTEFNPSVTYRPLPAVTFNPGIRYSRNKVGAQWVENVTEPGDHYVFGELDQTTVAVTLRLNYTMSPTLSLQLYGEPFVSAGDYSAFKELVSGRSRDYAQRYAPFNYTFEPDDDPNFNKKSFRTTNVLRWEYKPGSTLFVVWQQARENEFVPGGFRFGRDIRGIFGVQPRNTFLVKLAYWLNY